MITKKNLSKIKKTTAILTMSFMSVSSFAPLLVASTYVANADNATSTATSSDTTTIGDGNSSSSTSTSSSSTSTGTGSSWWWNIPTPPTPPSPPWWTQPGNGTTTGSTTTNGTSSFPWWWHFPTPPTPPTWPGWGNGTSTGTTTASTTVKVTIVKFIDGAMASASTSNNNNFLMTANYNSTTTGQGTGNYNLSASGYNGNPTPYQAITSDFAPGASYSTYENMNNVTGLTCGTGNGTTTGSTSVPFSLVGYTTGNTLAQAMAATPSMATPTFTNLMNDKYVIVWNHNCANTNPGDGNGTTTASTTAKVTILKFIDGVLATASSSQNMNFDMTAVYNSTSTGSGTETYTLGMNNAIPYEAATINFAAGADYATYENMNGVTGATCATSTNTGTTTPFMLMGYTVGNTLAQAMSAVPSMTYPNFTDLMNDKYVIVWNHNCGNTSGTIGGDVSGGSTSTASTSPGVLHVDSIETLSSNATADGTFEHGFKYLFNITAPTNEQDLAMKFADWTNTANSGIIPVVNNMRISSAQANSTSTITLTAANTYSGFLHIIGDLNSSTIGNQIKVLVETMIPVNTINGSYTTTYGVKTQ